MTALLAELKSEAAWAEVCFPFAGADILNMMAAHGITDPRETNALMVAADARHQTEFSARKHHPHFDPPRLEPAVAAAATGKQAAFSKAVDDEIPF